MRFGRTGVRLAAIAAVAAGGAVRVLRGELVMLPPGAPIAVDVQMMQWEGEDMLPYGSPMMVRERQNQQMRQQIRQLLDAARTQGTPMARRNGIESALVGMGPQFEDVLRSEAPLHTGLELDAFEGALLRLANPSFDPPHRLPDWARGRFGFVADPQAPLKPLPVEIARVMNIPPGSLLFPHHVFYAVTWVPTHTRIPLALATDGKVQTLEDDAAALLRFFPRRRGAKSANARREGSCWQRRRRAMFWLHFPEQ